VAITKVQRSLVAARAGNRCEYCLLHQDYGIKRHEPDHILPLKHGGRDLDENLAWACFQCNRYKGSDVAAYDTETGDLIRLFDPRRDTWNEHFRLDRGLIIPQSAVGRVTITLLQVNRPDRVSVRAILAEIDRYP
jgi:5-methylcytosine-specific restriction endonuclease McrA